jgi:FMN reductase
VRFVIVVGNPRPQSRTLAIAGEAAAAITHAAGLVGEPEIIDLSGLARHLLLPEPSAAVEDAIDQVTAADLLLVASPTFKGTYSGLLKVFLDRLPQRSLGGATAVPVMLMGIREHMPAVDTYLRPLLIELGAAVPGPALAVLESGLDDLDAILGPWADRVASELGSSHAPAAIGAAQAV